MNFDLKITPHYLQMLAPFTNGNHTLTEALTGAADRITALEQNLQTLRSGTDLPFPAITDRCLIERSKEQADRITELESAVRAAVNELEMELNCGAPVSANCGERVVKHLNEALLPVTS